MAAEWEAEAAALPVGPTARFEVLEALMSLTLRRTAMALGTVLSVLLLLVSAPATGVTPVSDVAAKVAVRITVKDTSGAPVVGWVVIGEWGPGDSAYDGAVTDSTGLALLHVPPNSTVSTYFYVLRVTPSEIVQERIVISAGSGVSTTIVVPPRWEHTYRVVDPAGRPVMGAVLGRALLVSTVVSDPVRGEYRMNGADPFNSNTSWPDGHPSFRTGGVTAANGTAPPMAWYQPEPDPAVVCDSAEWQGVCDLDGDGTVDGMGVSFTPYAGAGPAEYAVAIPYSQWAVAGPGTTTLHVPAVPVVDVLGQRYGTRPGNVVLTVRVRRPSGAALVPYPGAVVQVVPLVGPGVYARWTFRRWPSEIEAVTDADGVAEIHIHQLANPTPVSISMVGMASAAATVVPRPRPGISFRRTQYNPPGKDTRSRKSLNGEFFSLINTTSSPVSLKGWSVRNRAGDRYTFGRFTLLPGARVVVHTGPGRNTRTDRYWDAGHHLWSTVDKATLRRPSGKVVATCEWQRTNGITPCAVGVRTAVN